MVHPLWKVVWQVLKMSYIELPLDSAILLLGMYPGEIKMKCMITQKLFIEELFTIAKK